MELPITWRFIVGTDISKQYLDCYLLDRKTAQGFEFQVVNSQQGFQRLAQWLTDQQVCQSQAILVSEHTGRYGENLLRWSTEQDWLHAVVKTTALEKVTPEHHRKGDPYDARELADYGARFSDRLQLVEAPKPAVGQIKRLQAERRKMVSRRAALKSKLTEADTHDADMRGLTTMWKQQIELLSKHIDQLEQTMNRLIRQDTCLETRNQTMRTAPGIGPVLGRFWLSLFAGQSELDARKISSRFGFAPHGRCSGSSVKSPPRSTGHGNSEMRRLMHQAALSVKTHCPHYRHYYQRKRAEGKEHLLVINNIINKLIRLYCAMWNNKAAYDPNYIQKNKDLWKKSA